MWKGLGKKTVYLAGAINGCSDWEAKTWRNIARIMLESDLAILNPMARDYRGKEDENVREIVEKDLADIEAADYILVMALRPSWGTAMEVRHAYKLAKPIYVVVHEGISVSPWLRYHANAIYPTINDACMAIGHDVWERQHGVTSRFDPVPTR